MAPTRLRARRGGPRRPVVLAAATVCTALAATLAVAPAAAGAPRAPEHPTATPAATQAATQPAAAAPAKTPFAVGAGGGVASVDADATRIGLEVLAAGGNAADAAVATAAALGVTEPYSAGVGGGGYFLHYSARQRRVLTLDGRETAPAAMRPDSFVDPATGAVLPFADAVSSGLSVGVPGTPQTWSDALDRWGTLDLAEALAPAAALADDGFVVDAEFAGQTAQNADRFADFPDTAALFLPDGAPPPVGSVFRNPDLAATYRELGRRGTDWLYVGELGEEVVATAAAPPTAPDVDRRVAPGLMTTADLARYRVLRQRPTHSTFRGLDVYGMAPSSSGGSTVGEALNIIDTFPPVAAGAGGTEGEPVTDPDARATVLHRYLEASRLAYADRGAYLGDPAFVRVPLRELLSTDFAESRACLIDPDRAAQSPVAAGDPRADARDCPTTGPVPAAGPEGPSTTHLVAADRWGDVVSYTLTIEQTGGSGITVPGRGFLLNNELTDFDITPPPPGTPLPPNAPDGGKRPRSSMAPTIVLDDREPVLALGSPGGATIITTVLQTLVNRLELGMPLADAVAAPRLSQRNTAQTDAEPGLDPAVRTALTDRGHRFRPPPTTFAPNPEIGAVAALEFLDDGRVAFVAEPTRRGGGAAGALAG